MRLRDIMPKSLFGRSLFIVGLPLIFLQIFIGYFFFERHWDDVGRRLVLSVAGEIALISEQIIAADNNNLIEKEIFENSNKYFGAKLTILPNSKLTNDQLNHPKKSRLDRALAKSLKERIKFPHTFNTTKIKNRVIILVQLPNKILLTEISKKRLYSSTTYIFIAVMILSKFGYDVTAVTGKKSNENYLKSIGAKTVLNKDDFDKDPRPLDKGLWDGVVDTVGGKILANTLAQARDNGIVAACGNASDYKLSTTVMPFIIRGVKLWGINSVTASIKRREFVWNEVSNVIDFDKLEESIKTIGLNELTDIYSKMLKGETSGRYIVDVNK